MSESPFALDISAAEGRRRRLAVSGDLLTDEMGLLVSFRGEDDVEALLNDPRFSAVAMPMLQMSGVTEGPLHEMWSLLMFGKDADEHKRLRSTVAREFTPRATARYRDDIERYAADLADRMERGSVVELWSEFALPLSALAAGRVVGIPGEDRDRVTAWALDLVAAFFVMSPEQRTRAEAAAIGFCSYLDALIAAKRAAPTDDLTSTLTADDAAHDLTYEETRALLANLVFGGLEATAKVITTGVYHLLTHGQWSVLAEQPELAPHAVSELLRFAPPTGVARFASQDLVCRDVALNSDQMVILDLEAACRDARRVSQPERLQLDRADSGRQLAFGAGPHFCLGANLAKIVLETVFHMLPTRFPTLELACAPDDVVWDYETFSGIVGLPVAVS